MKIIHGSESSFNDLINKSDFMMYSSKRSSRNSKAGKEENGGKEG